MLTRIYGQVVFACDDCDSTLETGRQHLDNALSKLREESWLQEKVGLEWRHYCASCATAHA